MKKTLLALLSCAAVMTGASAARADSFTPAGSVFTFNGTVVFNDGFPITCTMGLVIASNAAGTDASVTAVVFTPGLCTGISGANLAWDIDVVAPAAPPVGVAATQIAIKGVVTQGLVRRCGPGTIVGNWNVGPAATIVFPAGTQVVPPNPGCSIVGTLTQVGGPPLVITN